MRVVYVTSGMLNCIRHEILAQRAAGWSVELIVDRKRGKPIDELEGATWRPNPIAQLLAFFGLLLRKPNAVVSLFSWLPSLFARDFREGLYALYEVAAAAYYYKILRGFDPQHIHVHFASRSLTLGIFLSGLLSANLSVTVHAFDLFMRNPASLGLRLQKVDLIAAVSKYNIDYIAQKVDSSLRSKCRVVHAGLDLSPFQARVSKVVKGEILTVSNLVEKKGHSIGLHALAMLKAKGHFFHWSIVGSGVLGKSLKDLANQLGLQDTVTFLGRIENDEFLRLFQQTELFMLPAVVAADGDIDGIPMALMEAMACEVPCVATNVSGIPELIDDGVTGFLAAPNDVASLADKILEATRSSHDLETIAKAGREKVLREFNIEITAGILREEIDSIAINQA
jgi:colanic acid/amylovoran biosynthesis glycosyltransferase